MADVKPLQALHYDLAAVGSLADVIAPPYDVIDPDMRRELLARSPFNVVEIDLPEAPDGGDPYEHAAETIEEWTLEGILGARPRAGDLGADQDYTGPDGAPRTRHGILCRVRVEDYGAGRVRPHERTQPGPEAGPPRLTRATRHNLSPIFSLTRGRPLAAVAPAAERRALGRSDRRRRHRQPGLAGRRPRRPRARWPPSSPTRELLIADGHHRYETARAYARRGRRRGRPQLHADGADRARRPRPHRLPHPPPALRLRRRPRAPGGASATALRELFEVEEVALDRSRPAGEEGVGVFGYYDSHHDAGLPPAAQGPGRRSTRRSPASPRPTAELDAAILETLVLKGSLGMSEDDIDAKRGHRLREERRRRAAPRSTSGAYDAAFILRPTPVEQVRAVAAAGETMPPKSTYFFPKLLTGLVFNPLG